MRLQRIELRDMGRDERGWVVDLGKVVNLHSVSLPGFHVASMKPGAVRGNHYHERSAEWLMLFSGKSRVLWRPPGGAVVLEERLEDEAPVLFQIPAGCPHAIHNLSSGEIHLLAFYDRPNPGLTRVNSLLADAD